MAAVTIREVASAAGVSASTVSLALNSPARVSAATRARVMQAVDHLGFVPKAEAVARARHGAGRVGLIGPFSTYPTARQRLSGVVRAASSHSIDVVVFDQESSATSTAPLLSSLPRTGRLDGLIITSLPVDTAVVDAIQHLGLPTVLLDEAHGGLSSIRSDNLVGGRLAAEHLLALGHRAIACISEDQHSHRYLSPAQQRQAGLRAALDAAGVRAREELYRTSGHDLLDAADVAHDLLRSPATRPSAIFASDDLIAAGALRAARHLHLAVPDELSIVGYDDTDLSLALELTTIGQDLAESGALAYQLLRDLMASHASPRTTVTTPQLRPRASTGPAPPP